MSNSTPFKRALITGATGYLGSNLAYHLTNQGWDVHIITRTNSDLKVLDDILHKITVHCHDGTSSGMVEVMANAKPEIVFHLASLFLAQHKTEDIESLIISNLLFSTQLVEAMAINGIRHLVNTGTSWQHYNSEDYNPVNLYAATKQAFEDILLYYIEAHGLKATTLALFDTYGPNDPREKLIGLLWKAANSQQPLSMSPGEQMIDLVHVDDVIRAYIRAADKLQDQSGGHVCYGVSSGTPIRLIDLVAAFQKATKTKLPISFGGRPYRQREVMVPWTSFQSLPEWHAQVPFEIGIRQTRPASPPEL
jgi:nucleoside-diphosphate-sugar epimerase